MVSKEGRNVSSQIDFGKLSKLAQDWKRAQEQALAAEEEERRRLRSEKAKLEAKKKPRKKQGKQQIADERNKSASKRYNNSSEILYRDARRLDFPTLKPLLSSQRL